MIGMLRNLIANWQICAIAAALSFALGSASTWRVMSWREQAHETQAVTYTLEYVQNAQAVTFDIGLKLDTDMSRIYATTVTIIREVPRYVTPEADARCIVPRGFVRLFNYSATDTVPASDPGNDASAPSDVACSTVITAVRLHDAEYFQARAQVIAWQAWYEQQKALAVPK